MLFERRHPSLGRVYICDGGPLGSTTLPASFTDRGLPAEAAPLTAEVLAELASAVAAIRTSLTTSPKGL